MRRILNSFYEWALTENLILKNPVKNIKPIKSDAVLRKPLDPLELEYMRQACKNIREKALIDFLYSTGCRVSELCDALICDIDWLNKTVLIRNGKGGKSRYVYINAECEVSLR
jgi:integrase/recombinase XerD